MPCTPEAIEVFQTARILYSPGKASNAGGVATSGLEMTQNSMRLRWTREEVDDHLKRIMTDIHGSSQTISIDHVLRVGIFACKIMSDYDLGLILSQLFHNVADDMISGDTFPLIDLVGKGQIRFKKVTKLAENGIGLDTAGP